MEIKGKTALVTGAAKRIGRTLAIELAKSGCNVVIHYRSSHREAEIVKKEVEELGVRAFTVQADLENTEDVFKLIKKVKNVLSVDILINNASVYYPVPIQDIREEDIDKFYSIHVKAPFFLSREFGMDMYRRGYGRIINVADYSAIRPYPNYTAYTISKGAMLTLTRALAKEFAPYVLVNAVLPGPIVPPPDLKDKDVPLKKTVLKKWGGETEVWKAVRYLIETDFTTGAFIPVEGGRLIF